LFSDKTKQNKKKVVHQIKYLPFQRKEACEKTVHPSGETIECETQEILVSHSRNATEPNTSQENKKCKSIEEREIKYRFH
jgi:hypothetical protein